MLFDDYDLVTGPTGGPLAPLLDVLAVGGDIGLHVVLARRVGGSARGAYEAVFSRLRELGSPGVLLSGDPGEGPLIGGTKARPAAARPRAVRAPRRAPRPHSDCLLSADAGSRRGRSSAPWKAGDP